MPKKGRPLGEPMPQKGRDYLGLVLMGALAFLALLMLVKSCNAKDVGQWQNAEPDKKAYVEGLREPDYPGTSCCGEGDMYFADKVEPCPPNSADKCWVIAVITDTRDDTPLKRDHVEPGTHVAIPPEKRRKMYEPNPLGHTVVFLAVGDSPHDPPHVYCYEPMGGL